MCVKLPGAQGRFVGDPISLARNNRLCTHRVDDGEADCLDVLITLCIRIWLFREMYS